MADQIHNRVSELRALRGLTQEDLARAVAVSRQTIIALEKGNYAPSVLLAMRIAKHFKVSVEDIFSIDHET